MEEGIFIKHMNDEENRRLNALLAPSLRSRNLYDWREIFRDTWSVVRYYNLNNCYLFVILDDRPMLILVAQNKDDGHTVDIECKFDLLNMIAGTPHYVDMARKILEMMPRS